MVTPPSEWFDGAERVLFVHAHPDDESIFTGGVIAGLNHTDRVAAVLTLTRGERGEVMPGPLARLESTPELATHRLGELQAALDVLGVTQSAVFGQGLARSEGLKPRWYEDSGMQWGPHGTAIAATDTSPDALTRASIAEALADLIAYADAIGADALVSYDEIGGYGHPDHVFAHRLARSTAVGLDIPFWSISTEADGELYDVEAWLQHKRSALEAHRSQLVVRGDGFELTGGQRHSLAPFEFFARVDQ